MSEHNDIVANGDILSSVSLIDLVYNLLTIALMHVSEI